MTEDARRLLNFTKTLIVLRHRHKKIQEEEEQLIGAAAASAGISDAEVVVHGRVYPGVKIMIGNAVHVVSKSLTAVQFKYDSARGWIDAFQIQR